VRGQLTGTQAGTGSGRLGITENGPARGPWTNLGHLPLRVFSIGKYAFQKKIGITEAGRSGPSPSHQSSTSSKRILDSEFHGPEIHPEHAP
jgi:hypothetical protein